jgi:ABC-type multidrug transport system fused ATPase/permease subunit
VTDNATQSSRIGPLSILAILRRHFGGYRGRFALLSVLGVVMALLEAAIVVMIAALASLLTNARAELSREFLGIEVTLTRVELCVLALGVVVARSLLELLVIELRARTDALYDRRTRRAVLDAFLSSDWALQSVEQAGGLQTTLVLVVSNARGALRAATDTVVAFAGLVIMLVASTAVGGLSALLIIAVLVAVALLVRPLLVASHRASKAMWAHSASFANRVGELVGLAREILVFDARKRVEEEADEDIGGLSDAVYKSEAAGFRLTAVNNSLIYLMAVGGLVTLIAVGVDNPQPYVAMVLLLYRAVQYGRTLQSNYQAMITQIPYVEKLDEQLARYRAAARPHGNEELRAPVTSIRFEDVSFSYLPGQPALDHVDLALEPGEAVGIVGPSGAGKSTLVQLLLGLRQPDDGRVLVNERPPAAYTDRSWSSLVTLVPQDAELFDRSVRDNIACFRDEVTTEAVVKAARDARILDEIQRLPDGFDTPIGPGGGRFSGGQRQRLCLARALAGEPAVIVLDEPTSALDHHSEDAIRQTLEALKGDVTLVIIAHRMSTLRICDRVIVVSDGRVEAVGAREELERDNPYYAQAIRLAKLV